MEKYLSMPFPSGKAAMYISLADAGDMGANTAPISENRIAFFKETGLEDKSRYPLMLEQIHSHIIHDAKELVQHETPEMGLLQGDGIISDGKDRRPLGVTIADCVPIFLYDTRTGAYGAFHSGWKGTGIAAEGVQRMVSDYGSRPEDIEAVIGPAIGGCCYQVNLDRYNYFLNTFGSDGLKIVDSFHYLDLKVINKSILSKLDLKNITVSECCTQCDNRFHSCRRTGNMHFSRMLAYIKILD